VPEPPVHPWKRACQWAGIVGTHPDPWRARDLLWAAEGSRRDAWDRTSLIVAQTLELHRDPKLRERPFDWREFHPHERAAFEKSLVEDIPEATDEDIERMI
jgi:hypothetical protein